MRRGPSPAASGIAAAAAEIAAAAVAEAAAAPVTGARAAQAGLTGIALPACTGVAGRAGLLTGIGGGDHAAARLLAKFFVTEPGPAETAQQAAKETATASAVPAVS